MPKICVAMPVYNDELYLDEAINSILTQTYKDFELLIINDGSTDNSLQIIESYTDPRIRLVNFEKNKGRPFGRNTALDKANGKYIVWMDADDISPANRLELQINFMEQNKDIALSGGYMQCFGDSTHLVRVKTNHEAIKAGIIWYSSILNGTSCMHLESIQKYGIRYQEELSRAQDYAFFAEVCLKTPLNFANIPENLLNCRYFNRPSNPSFHVKATKYILQALNLDSSELNCYKHSILSIGKHAAMPDFEPDDILAWANEVYLAVAKREDIMIEQFLRVSHAKIEHFLSTIPNVDNVLKKYASLPVSKAHIRDLFKKYV